MRSNLWHLVCAACLIAAGCGKTETTGWTSLADTPGQRIVTGRGPTVLPDGQPVEFEHRGGAVWGKVTVLRSAWQPSEIPNVVTAPAPLLGLGRPAYRLEIDGAACKQVNSSGGDLKLRQTFEPGTFGYWRNAIFLGVAEGEEPPEQATLGVRLDRSMRDSQGCRQVQGRRFSGRGISVWPGGKMVRTLDIPPKTVLSFGTSLEPASAALPHGGPRSFRVLVNDELVYEHEQEFALEGNYAWHSVPLEKRSSARLTLEVTGPFAYTAFMDPVLGPVEAGTYRQRPWPARPSIVLFLADTFRADNLALHGGKESTTPELNRFAENALRFARAWSVGTFTLPGHSALFSGLYPRQTASDALNSALPNEVETIAEVLTRAGYRTGAITDSAVVSLRFGLHQGFAWFDEYDLDLDSTLERAQDFLEADDGRPVFLFVQTYRTHLPYSEHEPPRDASDRSQVGREEYQRLMGGLLALGGPGVAIERDPPRARTLASGLLELYRRGATDLDRGFGEFQRDLTARGFPGAGYVLFTSDHGEAFYEHDELSHKGRVFEEQIRIPLLIQGPGLTPRTVQHAVSLVDFPPTLAAMAGVAPLPYWQGADILGLDHERSLYAFECAKTEYSTVAILAGGKKLIAREHTAESRLESGWRAYDLATDPHELRDVFGLEDWPAELFHGTAPMVDALLVPLVTGEASALDADRIEELNALGYAAEE